MKQWAVEWRGTVTRDVGVDYVGVDYIVAETVVEARQAYGEANPHRSIKSVSLVERDSMTDIADALDAFDAAMKEIGGCGDGYCFVTGKAKGQHTNAGCRCWRSPLAAQRTMRAARRLRDALTDSTGTYSPPAKPQD